MKKITADESHSYNITGVADAEAGSTDRTGAGKIDGRNGATAQHVGVPSVISAVRSYDSPTGIDPCSIGARCPWHVNSCKSAIAKDEAMLASV